MFLHAFSTLGVVALAVITHSAWIAYRNRKHSPGTSYFFLGLAVITSCLYVGLAIGNDSMSHFLLLCCGGYGALMLWAYSTDTQRAELCNQTLPPRSERSPHLNQPHNGLNLFWDEEAAMLPLLEIDQPTLEYRSWYLDPNFAAIEGNVYHHETMRS